MPGPRSETRARVTPRSSRPDGRAANGGIAAPEAGAEVPRRAPTLEETGTGKRRRRGAERGRPERGEVALRDLLRGLRAGDLESILLTVAMAADENRMPSADPDEAARILAFLARLAEHDAALPPPEGAGDGSKPPLDGRCAGDRAPDR